MIKRAKLEVVSVNKNSVALLNHTLHIYVNRKSKGLQKMNFEEGDEYEIQIKKVRKKSGK